MAVTVPPYINSSRNPRFRRRGTLTATIVIPEATEEPPPPPTPTGGGYIIDQSANYLTDQSGNRLLYFGA
jgi:hypothetical protein